MSHQVNKVSPMPAGQLLVEFSDGTHKIYDTSSLFQRFPVSKMLQDQENFHNVKVATGGNSIVWNDSLNLSGDELWDHGVTQYAYQAS